MHLIYLRHGERSGHPTPADDDLTPHGLAMAAEAGRWLGAHGHTPSHIWPTATRRARQTADAVAAAAGPPPGSTILPPRARTPGSTDALLTLTLDARDRLGDDAILCLVGHHTTQRVVEKLTPTDWRPPPNNRCAAFVFRVTAAGELVPLEPFAGVPQRSRPA